MAIIHESDLPGIGKKFQIDANSGDRLVIVIHDDGRRELYHFEDDDPEETISQVTLDDEEARQVASIIGGMQYKPKQLEMPQVSLDELVIEWAKVEPHSPSVGKTIAELQVRQRTGATILAFVEKGRQKINPGPDDRLEADMTVVVAGDRQQIKKFNELLHNG
ncbi:MAG: potassium:proton antiporter [Thermobacillus sp. ZCTH02-B1]|uniref:cation:proton antiporter regulatory subunit n=1 Tax=Thermobacillus sp. ZCTH02-B1 TaxID=1858795 RepID=UPI000B5754C9|nr:cation:proton antiporter regulatory subunit [Thermobacillus sp. ZCTH02-B1]OUM93638.1 MAG: potassium:proton antiporter [Thermobacillus sp. ZCTH02-B1]